MLTDVIMRFQVRGNPVSCERYGYGHINETYLVSTDAGMRYILQKINTSIFPDAESLMRNIELVTDWLKKDEKDPRRVMRIVKTVDSESYLKDGAYRMYEFVEGSVCLQKPRGKDDFYQSALAFGDFQKRLRDFDASQLAETIPGFHDTYKRYDQFRRALKSAPADKLQNAAKLIDFAYETEPVAGRLMDGLKSGTIPMRVTHNDTKLNNVLLDEKTGNALCVIDLDTVMPGAMGFDFGDSIRFGAATAKEDEKDMDRVGVSLEMFEAYLKGYMLTCRDFITPEEKRLLCDSARIMTAECGLRFLTDYLSGDTYFHTNYPTQNLDRCRVQFKLVEDMNLKWDRMNEIVEKYN